MTEINKIKRTALVLFGVVSLVFTWFLFWLIRTNASGWMLEANAVMIVATVLSVLFVVASLGVSLSLLHTIRKEETPFTKKIVRKLKTLAMLLIVFEPLNFALDLIPQLYEPMFIHYSPVEGTSYYIVSGAGTVVITFGGFIMAAGLVVYCVALTLQYGITLQTQVDETL